MNSSDSPEIEKALTNWRRELDKMLAVIETEATFSLKQIDSCFEASDQSLDEDFGRYFLQVSTERLSTCYAKVQIESNRSQRQTGGFIKKPSNQTGYHLTAEDQLTSSFLRSLVKSEEGATLLDSVVEILSSSDEEERENDESSGKELRRKKTEFGQRNDNAITPNTISISMNVDHSERKSDDVFVKNVVDNDWLERKQELIDGDIPIRRFQPNDDSTNDGNIPANNQRSSLRAKDRMMAAEADLSINQNSNGMRIKEVFDIEPKQEIIDEDIPIRTFNPNDVSSNGGYSTNSNISNKNSAGSSIRLKEDKVKPSCSKDARRFKCKHCEYGTDHKGDLDMRLRTHTNEKPFRCSRCFERFTQSSTLKSHLVIHMRTHTGNKPYRCSRCSKGFTALQSLKYHMTTHKDKRLPFHCKGCFRRFSKESEQKDHENGCRYRRYECDICKKYVTAHKTKMEIHMRVHTGEKPFRCEVCMKCFSVKCNLKHHLRTVHNRRNL